MSVDREAPLPPGKLPGWLLAQLIERYTKPDPSVLVGPAIGRDAAAIAIGDRVLIVKTDPITFVTSDAGRYLVHVNANDIACMGAIPRWLLVTALLPERTTTPRLAEALFAQIASAAEELNIALVGGHSEIVIGLERPILVGQLIGEASPTDIPDPTTAQAGDVIILAGGIATEGTAILAREAASALGAIPEEVIKRAKSLLESPGISVLPAVRALRGSRAMIRYLHDPTEGGLATALAELSSATGHGLELDASAIPIHPETTAICGELGLDPLGLIASGSLLAVVASEDAPLAIDALVSAGIIAAAVGVLTGPGSENVVLRNGERMSLPVFTVDEIARYFAAAG